METVRILDIKKETHDVMHIIAEKPSNLSFQPGQATDVSIAKPKWEDEKRPFTFTSLPKENQLEFVIKIYPDHDGVTDQIGKLERGDSLNIGDVYGAIEYKEEGIFIAGGAGVTPFISILKSLDEENKIGNNKLIFGNKKYEDIIHRECFEKLLGKNMINVLSDEERTGCEKGFINKEIIKKAQEEGKNQYIYLCGPPKMMESVLRELKELGVEEKYIVKEDFG
ncbi:flavodoxin reductase [Brumimicrobium glaciale]|uniref:Flavodoxin reductase n=1 Tax=Brumimicrobium glaciale TaxID=200475 RepID=A0A4Q4KQG5_9FLAO|nr:FAD-binding oxidoreductase [Brumimicrobium glaciale]RYM35647.1 flavodoxin reductase [Brumimicrobium glaciale]